MNLVSLSFFIFVLCAVILYYTVFRKMQWLLLLIASVVFYVFSGPKYIGYIVITTLLTYLFALRIGSLHKKEKAKIDSVKLEKSELKALKKKIKKRFKRRAKFYVFLEVIVNFGLLGVIKYVNFALDLLEPVLKRIGISWRGEFDFVLPLGMSFYTFMAVGYLLDVFWKRYSPEKNPLKLFTFLIYFPHILQGPISRFNKLGPQLFTKHKFDYNNLTKGLQLLCWGIFEKIVIADRLKVFATNVYSDWESYSGIYLVIAIIFFSMQLYMDFQGCMDIGRGVSQIFGIDLELNFWHPYFSKNMPEFWRRWHITLGAWFKDYLLYPISLSKLCKTINKFTRKHLGNNASRAIATVIPASCVWICTGVWHGAAMCYVLWGIYHGILIILSALFEVPIAKFNKLLHIKTENFGFNLFRMTRTFILSAIGRIFFVATAGLGEAIAIIKKTFDFRHFHLAALFDKSLYDFGLDERNFVLALLLILLVWIVSMLQEKVVIRDVIGRQNIVLRWGCYYLLLASILILGMYGTGYEASAFVYGNF